MNRSNLPAVGAIVDHHGWPKGRGGKLGQTGTADLRGRRSSAAVD